MSLNAAALRLLAEKGLTAADIVELAEALEQRKDATAAERKRRQREREAEMSRRDVTRDNTLSLDKEKAPTPPKEINPNPEYITPLTPQGGRSLAVDFLILEAVVSAIIAGCEHVSATTITPENVVEAWNTVAERYGLPKAKLTDQRRRKLNARIRQHSVEDFTEAIDALSRNPWLHGENDRGWRADFDFFLQPKSFTRLIEGSYDRTNSH